MRGTRTRPFVRACALCRGEGLGYVALRGVCEVDDVRATASLKDGTPVPCELFPVESDAQRALLASDDNDAWVVVLPLLAVDCSICVTAKAEEPCVIVFPALRSKIHSRLLATTKPGVAAMLRGYERRHGHGRTTVRIQEAWPADEGAVAWRIHASFPQGSKNEQVHLRVYDGRGVEVKARTVVMEDQVAPYERDRSQFVRLVTFSCALPEPLRSFFVVASSDADGSLRGFDGINAPRALGLLDGTRSLADGSVNDAVYERWLQSHAATDAERLRQREDFGKSGADGPLVSLVVCASQTQGPSLAKTAESVCNQTYGRWELVVVGGVDASKEKLRELAACDDERVRFVVPREGYIAKQAGIDASTGDYVGLLGCGATLEGDALWHFAQRAAARPNVDLLYCDEDLRDGVHRRSPSFKTFANYGKLYEYDFLGHLVLVSRWALDHAAGPCVEAGDAFGYDLNLRAFEVARGVEHVARVLYSGPCIEVPEEGVGCGLEAHEGGRRALQAHLARRGIAARVDDGMLMGTYRVCYELADPQPLVSIVIPTRDQPELLRACVLSVLKKTTYGSYELILVENNSEEQKTFALYEELMALDERVRVAVWEPCEQGGFNYSAIVNHGVSQAAGDVVVLLNNDTEVIEPRWLEEMLGCLMRPEVGVVGAKLLFGDGLIQHVGMVANPEGNFCHVCQNLTSTALGPSLAASMPGDYSMVTGACQMIRRSLYEELGGYDNKLAVGFNDGDFCLRVREAGYAVTVCAHALLHHREFSTRGRESTDARLRERHMLERARIVSRHADFFAQGDPAINPNLDPYSGYFTLRDV